MNETFQFSNDSLSHSTTFPQKMKGAQCLVSSKFNKRQRKLLQRIHFGFLGFSAVVLIPSSNYFKQPRRM
jgi:hypothetical protein